jgi:competence CoiA-like predicted nuclease
MPLRVPFGLRDGLLYEPRQVSNGKACGCICPGCQHPLVAKQNAQTPHFAHAPGEDCNNGTETAIHLAAKQLIAERMEVSIPAVVLHLSGGYGVKEST